jgi:hypothetical protein
MKGSHCWQKIKHIKKASCSGDLLQNQGQVIHPTSMGHYGIEQSHSHACSWLSENRLEQ